jgi:hypothetical protein
MNKSKRDDNLIKWLKSHRPKANGKPNYAAAGRVFHISRERVRQIVLERYETPELLK